MSDSYITPEGQRIIEETKFPKMNETRQACQSIIPKCPHCKRPMQSPQVPSGCPVFNCKSHPNRFDAKVYEESIHNSHVKGWQKNNG